MLCWGCNRVAIERYQIVTPHPYFMPAPMIWVWCIGCIDTETAEDFKMYAQPGTVALPEIYWSVQLRTYNGALYDLSHFTHEVVRAIMPKDIVCQYQQYYTQCVEEHFGRAIL